MKNQPVAASDEEFAQLVFQAQTTVSKLPGVTGDVFERVRKFVRLYVQLPVKPAGAALLYQEFEPAVASYREFASELVVGRLSRSGAHPDGADLAVQDAQMSRTHFQITLADGFYLLRDLRSRNGTYLNNNATRIDEAVIKAGDVILAGASFFIFTGLPLTNAS